MDSNGHNLGLSNGHSEAQGAVATYTLKSPCWRPTPRAALWGIWGYGSKWPREPQVLVYDGPIITETTNYWPIYSNYLAKIIGDMETIW